MSLVFEVAFWLMFWTFTAMFADLMISMERGRDYHKELTVAGKLLLLPALIIYGIGPTVGRFLETLMFGSKAMEEHREDKE